MSMWGDSQKCALKCAIFFSGPLESISLNQRVNIIKLLFNAIYNSWNLWAVSYGHTKTNEMKSEKSFQWITKLIYECWMFHNENSIKSKQKLKNEWIGNSKNLPQNNTIAKHIDWWFTYISNEPEETKQNKAKQTENYAVRIVWCVLFVHLSRTYRKRANSIRLERYT